MKVAGIDGDILTHKAVFASKNITEGKKIFNGLIRTLLENVACTYYIGFLGGNGSFRKDIEPTYKEGRKPRPDHYPELKQYAIDHHNFIVVNDIETDDALGICNKHIGYPFVICSIDKDLLQLPGTHYNIDKKVFTEISYLKGERFFYEQVLKGDKVDNIEGIFGMGEVGANKILSEVDTRMATEGIYECLDELGNGDLSRYQSLLLSGYNNVVAQAYQKAYPTNWEIKLTNTKAMVRILDTYISLEHTNTMVQQWIS
jgi:5'-3' exonuclease